MAEGKKIEEYKWFIVNESKGSVTIDIEKTRCA